MSKNDLVDYRDIDLRIWQSELDDFVPARVYDVHSHLYTIDAVSPGSHWLETRRYQGAMDNCSLAVLSRWAEALYRDREVHYLLLPSPAGPETIEECAVQNRFVAAEAETDPLSGKSMLVRPGMSAEDVADMAKRYGFDGLKGYYFFADVEDKADARITDYIPEELIEAADGLGLIITLHLSKRRGCADEENLADLERLTKRYPNVRWILAHCARAFAAWMMEEAIERLRELPDNVWYDTSAVCDNVVHYTMLKDLPLDRIMYASDLVVAATDRGKYVTFGYAWMLLQEAHLQGSLAHCEPTPTLICYESLRSLRRAALMADLDGTQVEDLFYKNAVRLLAKTPSA